MLTNTERLKQLYHRFNARDVEAVLALLHQDVIWANGMEGGYVHGHDGVREYWARQWSRIDPHVDPKSFSAGAEGRTEVDVHQTVRDLQGKLISDKRVCHIFQFEEGLVKRFDIEQSSPSSAG